MSTPAPSPALAHASESNSGQLTAVSIAFIVLDICFVALRFTSRRIKKIKFNWDDFLIILGLVNVIGFAVDCLSK